MPTPQVHCKIDEKFFSWTVFLTRFLAAIAILYTCVGCLLYYREFLYNASALGLPMPVQVGIGIVIVEMILALMLLLGWFTRVVSGLLLLGTGFLGVVFFASNFNKLYVALLILLLAALLPAVLLGPGRISLDFVHARRRVEKEFRG